LPVQPVGESDERGEVPSAADGRDLEAHAEGL
jgi:hypothetical protein